MKWRDEGHTAHWTVPYLPIDPTDIGREYEADVIRINSQSGKGGIGYILETRFGYSLPKKMSEVVGYLVKSVSDRKHKELLPDEVYDIFRTHFVDITSPLEVTGTHYVQNNGIEATVSLVFNGRKAAASDSGNGRLDAVSNAIRSYTGINYSINTPIPNTHSKSVQVRRLCRTWRFFRTTDEASGEQVSTTILSCRR